MGISPIDWIDMRFSSHAWMLEGHINGQPSIVRLNQNSVFKKWLALAMPFLHVNSYMLVYVLIWHVLCTSNTKSSKINATAHPPKVRILLVPVAWWSYEMLSAEVGPELCATVHRWGISTCHPRTEALPACLVAWSRLHAPRGPGLSF